MLDGEETVQIGCGERRWEGGRQHAGWAGNRGNSYSGELRWKGARQDGEETVEIACGEPCWEGARQHAGRDKTVEIACGELRWRERDNMLDG